MQGERRKNNDILFHFRKDGLPMTKLSQLKIDPEFQNQINPPSFEETHQLEMNILEHPKRRTCTESDHHVERLYCGWTYTLSNSSEISIYSI